MPPTERRSTPRSGWRWRREPDAAEASAVLPASYLDRQADVYREPGRSGRRSRNHLALAELCLALLNTSEFLYAE